MKVSILVTLLCFSALVHGQHAHRCSEDAVKQAKALLIFHWGVGANLRADLDVEDRSKVLAPMRNPVNRREYFDVLEVQGHVKLANYQMRLIYAQIPGQCVLMGQEIIQRASTTARDFKISARTLPTSTIA